ncbi:Uncharacterised protein [Pseudomonas aeruginosa]|nr:Uncharacterised protein [Pseudomonas aeruginosa]
MFYDYLTVEQVFPYQLPQVGDTGICYYDRKTGEQLRDTSPSFKVEGQSLDVDSGSGRWEQAPR